LTGDPTMTPEVALALIDALIKPVPVKLTG
jgi:hypothetical protein